MPSIGTKRQHQAGVHLPAERFGPGEIVARVRCDSAAETGGALARLVLTAVRVRATAIIEVRS
jgi:hypothetical protein